MIRDIVQVGRHVKQSLHLLRGVLLSLLIVLVACSVVLTAAENLPFGEALYLAAITALTVGYGDLAPITILGRITAVVIALLGVVYVGLVVAVTNHAVAGAVAEKRAKLAAQARDGQDA